ncbi:calcium/sodium antiporter [Mycobacterium sp. NAZ190054]|uniref:calcium/sodium antiporter n=1 Tax=Mycobacterium sp. NAZ190054 TaxID=1747766 RepID=UPI0007943EFE|nr:calcium/sodium antiporter [Mycobacterium sp. NAZ190054]KWX59120.1 sodium:calcium antiporter [Mycobacterium sp. NAZ190054]
MVADAAWFVVGLGTLVAGAEVMVRGATEIAARLGISAIVVGLTVVSVGTSMPELAIGVVSAAEGNGAMAVGNVAGANVINLMLVLGLSALILPLAIEMRTLRSELPVMAGVAVLLWVLAADGMLSRADGLILVTGAVLYTYSVVRSARRERGSAAVEFVHTYPTAGTDGRRTALHVGMTVGGIAVIVLGAQWLVDGAVGLARAFSVSDALIGLTVVALGTTAPELVTTVVSTFRRQRDVAVGNLLGSSAYNILLILGVTSLVPAHGIALPRELVRIDIPIMMAATLACIPIFISGRRVGRVEGGCMVAAYVGFLVFLLATQT